MYRGYSLTLSPHDFYDANYSTEYYRNLISAGRERYQKVRSNVEQCLEAYVRPDGVIDGAAIEADWFPGVKAHLFLSHSHSDEDLAIALSQWLYLNFGIDTFIDSCIWGYCDNLLKELDNRYALQGDGYYSYPTRNRTTGFVHALLTTALAKMMDSCECLFFLNTPNSIAPNPKTQETSSPWIYFELSQSIILRKVLLRLRTFSTGGRIGDSLNEAFRVALPASTGHLRALDANALNVWAEVAPQDATPAEALDILYRYTKS